MLTHPLLVSQLEKVVAAAEGELAKHPDGHPGVNRKLLRNLLALMFDEIPEHPGDGIYRQGGALGPELKDWFRGKTGNGRYRLFYRFDSKQRVIVYAWINDEASLRAYGKRTDAYAVFRRMVLHDKNPPKDWAALRAAAETEDAVKSARDFADRHDPRGRR